jgi:gelsolin
MPASLSGVGLKAGLLVWRVENFELAPVDEAHHGQFYSGDSYVLLRTTASGSSTANELFVWQGEDSSQDERGASAIQSVRVAEAVSAAGGTHCSQSRETQGNESDAFKAVFKGAAGAGLIYLQGGVKSGFHHVEGADAAHEPSLLHVKGRRSVVTRQVAVAARSLNQGDCFILDLFSTLFLWAGAKANTVEKAKAVEVMARLSNSRGAHCERVVLATADAARAGHIPSLVLPIMYKMALL